jgi:hypothetical protein
MVMNAKARLLLVAALLVLPPAALAQQPNLLPPVPVPVAPPGPPPVPPVPPGPPPGPPPVPPAPSTGLADPGPNGWAIYGPPSAAPLFFVGVELDFLKPVFKNHLQGTVTLPDGSTDTLNVPSVPLGWTVSPSFEFGYRLPDSCGEFLLRYRFLATDGTGTAATDVGDVGVKSRLNINVIDLDYNTARYQPWPRWDWRWTLGARIATAFYDTSIGNDTFGQSASNYFYGAGPHAALELERKLSFLPAFGFFVKGDASVLVGQVKQRFSESFVDAAGDAVSTTTWQRKTQSVEVLNIQAGASYTPTDYLRFTLGYEYEHWFSLGREGDSRGELTTNGVFLRGQFDF